MQFRVLLSLIGQLIAVPAALLLAPAAYPDLHLWQATGGASSGSGVVEDDLVLVTPTLPEESVEERLGEITALAQKSVVGDVLADARRRGEGRRRKGNNRSRGRRAFRRDGALDELRSRLVYATDGLGEALNNMAQPFQDFPRRAGDMFSSIVNRGGEDAEEAAESDSTVRYLAELQLAQESAERALGTPGWEEVTVRNGVTVWKKYFPKDEYGYKYPCVKARGIIDGSAEEVMGMIVDSTRVSEYNRYSVGRTDIEHLGPHTKIVWNKAQPPLTKKLHDFCTLMHMQALDDGAFMLITRATEHPEAPLLEGHVRSEILLGVTILRPAEGDPTRTEMTTVNHIVSNGVPVMIADRVSTKNAIDFIQNVEIAALAAAAGTAAAAPA